VDRGRGRCVGAHSLALRRGIKSLLASLLLVVDASIAAGRKETDIMNRYSLRGTALIVFAMAAACASTLPASGASVVVLDRNFPAEVKVTGTHFEVDEKAGEARLVADLLDESFEGRLFEEPLVVSGLVFDREHREVRYESDGSSVTCAAPKKVLWATTWPETGACRITIRKSARTVDGGSGARAVTGWVVELATNEPAKSAALER
jgi:hypothetical protein